MNEFRRFAVLVCLAVCVEGQASVDYKAFLAQHDMTWDRVPNRWEVAPYTGNGNVGFLFYQAAGEAKNVISLYTGRHDYYDHRAPHDGDELLWIYRSRLPLGRFNLTSKGEITGVDLRLDLYNAELTGTVTTTKGSYALRGFSHSLHDVIYFETRAENESVQVSWHPDVPKAPVRETLERGGGPKGGSWDKMRVAPYELPPKPTLSEEDGVNVCYQPLYKNRGETTTGWKVRGDASGEQVLLASVHHSFPESDSRDRVKANLERAIEMLARGERQSSRQSSRQSCDGKEERFFSSHRKWWNDYYPLSFLTINDPEKEAFYWIQMYKFASATRGNGPVMDLMGPWYHRTFWPMVWGDLNVELQYWTHLTANRLDVGSSLCNWFDKHEAQLFKNVSAHWKDSAGLSTCFPQDLAGGQGGSVPDMLCWIMHNYWLHCEFAGDRERMRDGLFSKLRGVGNGYLNYLKDNPVSSDDGTIHIKNSWSPEYPGGRGQDINFTIGLMKWCFQTLLDINAEHNLNDPLAGEWQKIVDNLVDFQIDEDGLRIGKDIPFDKPHRHYSHLLPFYPLAMLTPDSPEMKKLMRTTLDHWLYVTFGRASEASAMAVTGYTATGAASMYAWLADAKEAYHYLDYFIQHDRVSPTTMYAEGNPVIESPLSFATCIHDMLLQSWGGVLRVFPAAPEGWSDVAFKDYRGQGAFLVSAKKAGGTTRFVTVESLIGSPCVVWTDIPKPVVYINGRRAKGDEIRDAGDGMYEIELERGDVATLTPVDLEDADLVIQPIAVGEEGRNLFGLNEKTTRLPGYDHYYGTPRKKQSKPTSSLQPAKVSKKPLPAAPVRYVRIELPGKGRVLSLAEVEVVAGGKNVALGKQATQSSTRYSGDAGRAVDGNSDGDYNNGSVTHTDPEAAGTWWEVDLGASVKIDSIRVYNRRGNADRLEGFTLKILDGERNVVYAEANVPQSDAVSFTSAAEKTISLIGTKAFPGEKSDFRGYDRYDRIKTSAGHFSIVCPKKPAPGKPWLWRSLFWEAIKKVSNADLKLVDEGYHVVLAHGDVAGHPKGNANISAAYELLTTEYGFSKQCSMSSMSRGTLSLFRWATENPEKVSSIYVDNGVCNVLSWPAGKVVPGNDSIASGAPSSWEDFKRKFGYATDAEALRTKESPIDLLEPLAKAGVPILMVCGNKDHAVPYEENDAIMEQRYKALGGDITVIVERKGHSHGMNDPTPVLEFIRKHAVR